MAARHAGARLVLVGDPDQLASVEAGAVLADLVDGLDSSKIAELRTSHRFGESIGHYENGDTLVVDTIGLNTRTFVDSFRTPHTEQLHVVERFRIVDGGKALEVNVHVEDSGAFTMPWNAMQRYRRVEQGPMREAVCAENNAKFFNYEVEPIPQSDKPDF